MTPSTWLPLAAAFVFCPSVLAQDAPKVVSLMPENGAVDVDPKSTTLTIAFDQSM